MSLPKDERDRILLLLEKGQLNATDAGQLLDALEIEPARTVEPPRARTLRIRATTLGPQAKHNYIASMPIQLLKTSIRLGGYLLPQLDTNQLEEILRSIEEGTSGRLLDLQDLEQGERLEIYVE